MKAGDLGPPMKREPATYAIPRFSVSRPVTVLMMLLAMLVVGYIAYTRIPIALYPEGMEGDRLNIYVRYPNASPHEVEEKITRKIEDIIGTVPNVKQISSHSGSGYSYVRVQFETGTRLRDAYATLSDRMDRVKPLLPDDVDRISVRRWDQNDSPMMNLVATLPPDMDDAAYRLENFVKPALQRIEGVGNVDIWGIQLREVRIELNDERLRSHRVDVASMISTLRNQNFTLAGGYVHEGGRKIYVRSLGRFTSVEEIGSLIIDPHRRLRLNDVAEVSFRMPQRDWIYRVDGKPAIGIQITRDSTGNIARISDEVQATLKELRNMPQLAGMKFEIFMDQGAQVRKALRNLEDSGLWGGFFAAFVIFLFLRAPRMTLILTLSIPLSLLCTLVVLYFMDWSMNMATMMGLVLAVGLVVDNAIVIVENIYRRRQEGIEATRASILGAGEVGLAVMMSTLTTIVVFLPLMLMSQGGEIAFWLKRIGVPVIVSLLASLFIALIFVPLAAQRLSRGKHHDDLRAVVWLRGHYSRTLRWVLTHRLDAAIILAAAGLLTWQFSTRNALPRSMAGQGGGGSMGSMWVFFDLPSGGDIEGADAFFSGFEAFLEKNKDLYNLERFETRFGYNNGRVQLRLRADPNNQWYEHAWSSLRQTALARTAGGWFGWAPPPLPMDRYEIDAHIRAHFDVPAGINMRSRQRGSSQSDDSGMSLSLYGEDTGTLMALGEEAVRRLRTIPGLLSVDIDTDRDGQELRIQLDRDRARQLGINPQAVSNNISNAIRGLEVGRFNVPDGRELRVYAQLSEGDRQRIDDVRSMTFPTDSGIDVPLESLASLDVARTLGQIRREDRQTILRITARAPRGDARALFAAIDHAMGGFELPRGYRWDKGDSFSQMAQNKQAMNFAIVLAVVFVFLLMGILFESVVLPLAVIVAVPFAFLGVYWTLYLTSTGYDRMAMVGSVILVGVVVNNAIVLVDMTNRLRNEGAARLDALLAAGRARFRPILMTTFTTVFGLMPMALGNSRMIDMPYAPLGRTIIGGLFAATLLTLVLVPLFYSFLDDLRTHIARVFASAFGRGGRATPAPAVNAGAQES
jgi:hydrophobic/amphiphilic exporter-1 (mainly G- bacteria), HAE1 family